MLLEGSGEEVTQRYGQHEAEPVVDVVTGPQDQAENESPARVPAELLQAGQQIAVDEGLLGDRRDRRRRQPVDDVVSRQVPERRADGQLLARGYQGREDYPHLRPGAVAGRGEPHGWPDVRTPL